jgi:YgiT-type zinc finger domain-containing protein
MTDSDDSEQANSKSQLCPTCASVMLHERRDNVIEYRGHFRTIEMLGWWCQGCGEAVFSGEALVAYERERQALRNEANGNST